MKRIPLNISLIFLLGVMTFCSKPKKEEVSNNWEVYSPDSTLRVSVIMNDSTKQLFYTVDLKENQQFTKVVENSLLGITRDDEDFSKDLSFDSKEEVKTIDENYELVSGKQLKNRNYAKELSLAFTNKNKAKVNLVFRAYNDGVAFKYHFPAPSNKAVSVIGEATTFKISPNGKAWLQTYGQATEWGPAYEDYYSNGSKIGESSPDSSGWSVPALFQTNNSWVLISEADLDTNFYLSHLSQHSPEGAYTLRKPLVGEGLGMYSVNSTSVIPFSTPWRTLIIGKNLGTIVESNLISHLSKPSQVRDVSWIKPGRSSWSWWSDHASSKQLKPLKEFVDLAAEMGWEYSLIDANWDIMEGGTIHDLIKYANEKKVGLVLWYNSGGPHNNVTERPREIMSDPVKRKEEFKKLKEWGIKGIKVDFWQSDKQQLVKLYEGLIKDAADNNIAVVLHGCTGPRGWSRTYPNLLSLEAVKGAEQYGWDKKFAQFAPEHNIILAYTRNVVGPMDYTPVTLSDYSCCPHATTNANEIALSVLFESGVLHFADKVSEYRKLPAPAKNFLKKVPVAWDETKFIDGYPGKSLLIARRKGENWFVAGANGDSTALSFNSVLPFLKEGNYEATVVADGKTGRELNAYTRAFKNSDTLSLSMLPKGGFVVMLEKK